MKKKVLFVGMLLLLLVFAFAACNPPSDDGQAVQSISIESAPTKLDYTKGELLSLAGGKIKVKYNNGEDAILSMGADGITVSPTTLNTVGEEIEITVTYLTKTATFTVKVADASDRNVVSISIESKPSTLSYFKGDSLLLAGGKIRVKYDSGTDAVLDMTADGVTASPMLLNTLGAATTITVSYKNKTATFAVKVTNVPTPKTVKSISIQRNPNVTDYVVGDTLSVVGGQIKVLYTTGTSAVLDMTASGITVSATDLNTAGKDTQITVTYETKTATFAVDVYEPVTELTVQIKTPAREYYFLNNDDTFSLEDGELLVRKPDGTLSVISMTAAGVASNTPDITTEGDKTVTLTYLSKTVTFDIHVVKNTTPVGLADLYMDITDTYAVFLTWFNEETDDSTDYFLSFRAISAVIAEFLNTANKQLIDSYYYLKCIVLNTDNPKMTLFDAYYELAYLKFYMMEFNIDDDSLDSLVDYVELYIDAVELYKDNEDTIAITRELLEEFLILGRETRFAFCQLLSYYYVDYYYAYDGDFLIIDSFSNYFSLLVLDYYFGECDNGTWSEETAFAMLSFISAMEAQMIYEFAYDTMVGNVLFVAAVEMFVLFYNDMDDTSMFDELFGEEYVFMMEEYLKAL